MADVATFPSSPLLLLCVACSLRYNPNLQQAAKQQSWILSQPGCPFQHQTCSGYCNLYPVNPMIGGSACSEFNRMAFYETAFTYLSENLIFVGSTNNAEDPFYGFSLVSVGTAA